MQGNELFLKRLQLNKIQHRLTCMLICKHVMAELKLTSMGSTVVADRSTPKIYLQEFPQPSICLGKKDVLCRHIIVQFPSSMNQAKRLNDGLHSMPHSLQTLRRPSN